MSLANSYRPKKFEEVVEQSLAVDILKSMCSAEELKVRNFMLTGPAGTGKAQPLSSKVLTPDRGFICMGDIRVGDKVYTHNSNVAEVKNIYPQGIRKIYRITLEDDTYIEVSDEHNNLVEFAKYNGVDCTEYIADIMITRNLFSLFETQKDLVCFIPSPKNCTDYPIEHLSSNELDSLSHRTFHDRWRIKSVVYVRDDDCQCIYVDHEDHSYISDNFIPTHNTTLARIMADTMNSGQGEPVEIDAASHGGVEDVRDIVEQARLYPLYSKWKVFIIDEAHLVSPAGWGAFLKCIEENPGQSIFIFATTNPEKVPDTILSRVQLFQLSKISTDGIRGRLKDVLDSEIANGVDIKYTDDALNFIAKLSCGGMRNALTMLDKVLAYTHDITSENAVSSLNLPNYDNYFDLVSAYASRQNSQIAKIIDDVYNSGINFVQWFELFYSFVLQLAKCVLLQDITTTTIPSYYGDRVANYGPSHVNICVKLSNILSELIHKLKTTQYQQETALTYLLYTQ